MNFHIPRRFNVIPCEGKRPIINWQEYLTRHSTEEERTEWEKSYPNGNSFGRGIVCGPISGLFVLDVDEGGEKSLEGYAIPNTITVRTPHGRHHYFSWVAALDDKVTTKVGVLSKVDCRGMGGFCKFYGWEHGPNVRTLLAPPQWLIDLLPNRNAPREIEDTFKKLDYEKSLRELKDSPRHNTLYQIAGGLRARGYTCNEIYELLLPKGREVELPDKDVRYIADRMDRYTMGMRPPLEEIYVPENFEEFLQDERKIEYLVDGIFSKSGIAFVAGLPETCKSWTLIDLALELARPSGGMWLGKYPTNHAKVLYIDQERPKAETQRRFKALIAAKEISPKDLNGSLTVQCGTTVRLNLDVSFEAFRKQVEELQPEVILIDSYKAFQSDDINSHVAMQAVMEKVKAIRNTLGCSFIFLMHENKGAFERVGMDGKKKEVSFDHIAGALVLSEVAESILITAKNDARSSWMHHVKNSYGTKVAPVIVNVEDLNAEKSAIKVIAR